MADLNSIVAEIDRRAGGQPIGLLQAKRKARRGYSRQNRFLFGRAQNAEYAFHRGSRDELQFNLGIEPRYGNLALRFGVAFSLETSRTITSIDFFLAKIARFNDYLREHVSDFADLKMWSNKDGTDAAYPPRIITSDLAKAGTFIFLGSTTDPDRPDYDKIMEAFDRLLPLYDFVETGEAVRPLSASTAPVLGVPGCPPRKLATSTTLAERTLDINLRHNALQLSLYEKLVEEFGAEHVWVEQWAPGAGGRIDVLVVTSAIRITFEIKTASTARGCIREAMGQLLDYGFWPSGKKSDQLVIVGEPPATDADLEYLRQLNQNFPRPISYRQMAMLPPLSS